MEQHQPEWDFYTSIIEDETAAITLDIALADVAPIEDFPWLLWFSVKLMKPDEAGFPMEEEEELLDEIEEEIIEQLDAIDAIPVGKVQSGGIQDYYFYGATPDGFENMILEVMKQHPDYLFATEVTEDPEWDEYLGHLYPDQVQYQSMLNRHVVEELEEQGDKLDQPRDIDHVLVFADEKGRESFKTAVISKGFAVLSETTNPDDKEFPYSLNIMRKDSAEWEKVDVFVQELCQLAELNKGNYDGWGCNAVK